MDRASHLSVVLDLSPVQWHLSGQPTNVHPLPLSSFLSQLLAFLNAHIACKDENTLAVFGAFPGQRHVPSLSHNAHLLTSHIASSTLLYSSSMTVADSDIGPADANTYRPFKVVDSTVMKSILDQVEHSEDSDEECTLS